MSGKLRKQERRDQILEELRVRPHVRVATLAEKFHVTTETIRRDLDALSAEGLVNRAYGGASARPMGVQPSVSERGQEAVLERARIGAAAAALVGQGEVIMVDAGSTTIQFARHIGSGLGGLTVITNCYPVALELDPEVARVVMCAGDYDAHEGAVFGPDTLEFLRRFHANKTFIGASGLSPEGFSDVNRNAAWVKRVMIERAEEVWLLADHTKVDAHFMEVIAPLDALTGLVTDQPPPARLQAAMDRAGVRCVVAEAVTAVRPGVEPRP